MKLGHTLALGCAIGALGLGAAASAQPTGSPAEGTSPPAETAAVNMGEIIVTAQRRAERLQDVPLTITAQTGEQLARTGVGNVRELSAVVPGLSFTTQGTFAQPSIRGVQTTVSQAGADSPVAIYVDGFYQPNQLANLFDLPDIQRVEVLKGPQGTLFGRNATAGAIAIHTLDPSFTPTGKITLSDGIYFGDDVKTSHDFTAKGYVSGPIIDDVLAVGASGYYEYVDGFLTNDLTGGRTGRIEKYLLRLKLLFRPVDGVSFLLSGIYGERDDEQAAATEPLRGNTSAAFYPDAVVPLQPWHVAGELKHGVSPASNTHKGVYLESEFDIGRVGTLTSLTGYTDVAARTTADIDAAYSPSCLAVFGCIIYDLNYPSKTFQQELSFASEQFGALSFVAGAFYYHDSHRQVSNINPPLLANGEVDRSTPGAVYLVARIKTEAVAGFGEVNWDVTDDLRVIGGLRYSWEKKSGRGMVGVDGAPFEFPTTGAPSWDSWTPRLSLRYDLSPSANIYATYSKGFKSGVLDATALSNDIANPEELTSYEVGAKIGTAAYGLNVAAFYYDYTDLQVQFFDGTRTILANAADAELYGFEADGTVSLTDSLQLRLGGSWVPRAKYKDFPNATDFELPNTPFGMRQVVVDASGMRLLKAPKFTGSAAVNFETDLDLGKLDANANLYYSDGYDWNLSGRVRTGSYVTLNGQIAISPADTGFRVSIFGKNLTNKAFIGGTILAAQADAVVYSPPRQVGVSVDYSF